jgi:hypothetical protein
LKDGLHGVKVKRHGRLVTVVVVVVPVAFGAPAVFVLIPPAVPLAPAAFSRVAQFTALVICLPAVATMSLDGLVEFMLGVRDPALAAVNVFCVKSRHRSGEH